MYGSLSRENLLSSLHLHIEYVCIQFRKPPGRKKNGIQMKQKSNRTAVYRARKVGKRRMNIIASYCFMLLSFGVCICVGLVAPLYTYDIYTYSHITTDIRVLGFPEVTDFGVGKKERVLALLCTRILYTIFFSTNKHTQNPSKYCHSAFVKWVLVWHNPMLLHRQRTLKRTDKWMQVGSTQHRAHCIRVNRLYVWMLIESHAQLKLSEVYGFCLAHFHPDPHYSTYRYSFLPGKYLQMYTTHGMYFWISWSSCSCHRLRLFSSSSCIWCLLYRNSIHTPFCTYTHI